MNNRTKKVLIFALFFSFLVFIIFGFGGGSSKSFAKDRDYSNVSPEEMFAIQEKAVQANEIIYASFGWDETYIYPEEFAGTFIDYDVLHIQLTDENKIPSYRELVEEFVDSVVFDIVDSSYNKLYECSKAMAEELMESFYVVSYGVDIKNNCGMVFVDNQQATDLYKNYNSSVIINGTEIEIKTSERIKLETSYYGGTAITVSTSGMTLAGSGSYQGGYGFLTCGHGTNYVGEQLKRNGTAIGAINYRSYSSSVYGDYSIASAFSGYTSINRVYSGNGSYTIITGTVTNPAVGTYVYKYGAVSGEAYCQITSTGQSVNASGIIINGMTLADIVSGTSAAGDSGGPYRVGNSFCGVHHGVVTNGNSSTVVFTPYVYPNNSGFSW